MATITKRKTKSGVVFQAKVRRAGYPPRSETFRTRAAAEAWGRQIESEIDAGKGARTRYAASLRLGEALERYEREITAHKRSPQQERRRIKAWREHWLADRKLDEIRPSDVARARDELKASGLGPNSIRLALAPLSHVFTVARSDWGLDTLDNPVRGIRKPKLAGTERDRRLRPGEIERLEAACRAGPAWLWPAVQFAIESAMRRNEIARLRWSWIDLERRVARFPQTKTTGAVEIPLVGRSLDVLAGLEYRGDLVFGVSPDAISRAFWNAAKRVAKLDDLRFHDLRHEATSRLFEAGYTVAEVKTITRHKTLAMLSRYLHLRPADVALKKAA